MLRRNRLLLLMLVLLLAPAGSLFAQWTHLDWKMHNVGKVRQVIVNTGALNAIDANGFSKYGYPGLINCEFPPNSDEEHIFKAGFWVGAITDAGDTLVSVTKTHFTPDEFYPTNAAWDTIWVVSKGDTVNIPYWPDYVGVSDQDFVCRYSDYNVLNIKNHTPLYLEVIQTSYAWSSPPLNEFIVYRYSIIPKKLNLNKVFISIWLHGEVGNIRAAENYIDEYSLYFPKYQMIVDEDAKGGDDGDAISPIGMEILSPRDSTLRWSFKWYTHEGLAALARDPNRYRDMSGGEIMQDRMEPARAHMVLSFGPFERVKVGDTLHFEMAEVFGYGMKDMMKNAKYLEFLRAKKYRVPSPPPKPFLKLTIKSHEVHLSWKPTDHDNPETYQDSYRGDNETVPFEGYRLYKSTQSITGPWTLLAEYDLPNDVYGSNTGLEHDYTDVGLLNNMEYYYSVTAFSKPDTVTHFPSQESSVDANARVVIPGTGPPKSLGKVIVVPNPYRGDADYNAYNPEWEKNPPGRPWMEQDRRVQFINLPARCEIKVYTLAGDLVTTILHNDPDRGYEDWNLTSHQGQAISSGIYLFTVKETQNNNIQVGKFVVIK
ncbi:hypothetical protein BMS3Abin05_00080 [bacterium BMS3Abin05]|nr:hypothetical protein BMS3Abin05_00080 [bacterium BMS3Abin05]